MSYGLRYDDASAGTTWTDALGAAADSLALTYTVSQSIQVGETYLFQYRAKNIHGWSDWSESLALIAAAVPTKIAPPAVTFVEQDQVRIQWTLPAYDGGKPITGYLIEILSSDGSTGHVHPTCDGAGATAKADLRCLVSMSSLRQAPFLLQLDDLVQAVVTSRNIIGSSLPSDPNSSGAHVMTEPAKPAPGTRIDEQTSDLRIGVSFPAINSPPANGGS